MALSADRGILGPSGTQSGTQRALRQKAPGGADCVGRIARGGCRKPSLENTAASSDAADGSQIWGASEARQLSSQITGFQESVMNVNFFGP